MSARNTWEGVKIHNRRPPFLPQVQVCPSRPSDHTNAEI